MCLCNNIHLSILPNGSITSGTLAIPAHYQTVTYSSCLILKTTNWLWDTDCTTGPGAVTDRSQVQSWILINTSLKNTINTEAWVHTQHFHHKKPVCQTKRKQNFNGFPSSREQDVLAYLGKASSRINSSNSQKKFHNFSARILRWMILKSSLSIFSLKKKNYFSFMAWQ